MARRFRRRRMRRPRRRFRRGRRRKFRRSRPIAFRGGNSWRKIGKFRYCGEISINAGSASKASHTFNLNSMFDPDTSGGGHQPLGFDQAMEMYDHYTVVWARIKVQEVFNTTGSTVPAYFGIVISDNGTAVSSAASVSHLLEQYGVGAVTQAGFVYGPHPRHGPNTAVTKQINMRKYFNVPSVLGPGRFQGTAGAGPTESVFAEIFCASIHGNDPGIHEFLVTVDFLAVLAEPKHINQS